MLRDTMPTRVHGHFTKQAYATTGISSAAVPCLGLVILDTRVGRRLIAVKYTVFESLPAAAIEMHAKH